MKKILNIVGARPQIIKAAALSRAIRTSFSGTFKDIIVHTGQHYDYQMSDVFFKELEIPQPYINMNVGSSTHAVQTAQIMVRTEEILHAEKPDVVVVYGDTNSTLAVSVVAAKMHFPVAHIEAGLRSFNKFMPEEINRISCDHVSTLLYTPTQTAVDNLINEGFKINPEPPFNIDNPAVLMSGDIMYDNAMYFKEKAAQKAKPEVLKNIKGDIALVTIHREQNTDDISNLKTIAEILIKTAEDFNIHIVFPVHPRTVKALSTHLPEIKKLLDNHALIHLIEPVSYLEILSLLQHCRLVLTDSGGLQKEAYFMQKPCIILRTETEWVEIVKQGAGIVTGINADKVKQAVHNYLNNSKLINFAPVFGNGKAAHYICEQINKWL